MESLHAELDKHIRDFDYRGKGREAIIKEVRGELNGFLRFNIARYKYKK
jgi:hypothetical protein